jgi:hypothetical protein
VTEYNENIKKICEIINGNIVLGDYYIQRKLKRFIQIDRKILDKDVYKEFLVVHTEKDFEEKCKEKSDKSIHFLKDDKENLILLWQKSKGSISDFNKYIIRDEYYCLSIDQNQILNQNENIIIISADPGMGKSTILDKLIQSSNSELFFIKIILKNITESLDIIKQNRNIFEEQNFFSIILCLR